MAQFEIALKKTPESFESMYKRMIEHRTIDKSNGCWLWDKHLSEAGYGIILQRGTGTKENRRLKRIRCHVISLTIHRGDKTEGAEACHNTSCPNKNCFNPDHLRWGTRSDNIRDTLLTGNTNLSVLSVENVREIRDMLSRGIMGSKIAKDFGVSGTMVSRIKLNKSWRFV